MPTRDAAARDPPGTIHAAFKAKRTAAKASNAASDFAPPVHIPHEYLYPKPVPLSKSAIPASTPGPPQAPEQPDPATSLADITARAQSREHHRNAACDALFAGHVPQIGGAARPNMTRFEFLALLHASLSSPSSTAMGPLSKIRSTDSELESRAGARATYNYLTTAL